jgi:hypothetical protein
MSFYIFLGLIVAGFAIALAWFLGADKKFKAIREGLPVVVTEQTAKVKGWFGKLTSIEWWKTRTSRQWLLLLTLLMAVFVAFMLVGALTDKPAEPPATVAVRPPDSVEPLKTPPMFDVGAAKRKQAKRTGKAPQPTPEPTNYEPWTPAPLPEPVPDLPAMAIAKAPEVPAKPVIPLTARQQAYEDRQAGRSLSFNQEK